MIGRVAKHCHFGLVHLTDTEKLINPNGEISVECKVFLNRVLFTLWLPVRYLTILTPWSPCK